jgi:hypothetical protein
MAGIGIYFEKYYLENSIAILQKPESLYWFECPQGRRKISLCFLTIYQRLLLRYRTPVTADHFLSLETASTERLP